MTQDEIRELKHALHLLREDLANAIRDADAGKNLLPGVVRAGWKEYHRTLGLALDYIERLEAAILPPGCEYSVSIPIIVATNGEGNQAYLAWVDARIHQRSNTLHLQQPIYGYGATEGAAVLDLIRKLRKEAD